MKKKPQSVYVPLTMCSDCGGMRCAMLGAIREHPDFEDGNLIIVTLLGIVAELRAQGARDGEIVH